MKASYYVEFAGKQVEEKEVIAKVKELWVAAGNKVKDIETLNVYVKPEEACAYYVVNNCDETAGKIEL